MEFKIQDLALIINADIIKRISADKMIVKIKDKERTIQILSYNNNGVEFMLDNSYHYVKYTSLGTAEIKMVVDGDMVTVNRFPLLDSVVQRSSGTSSARDGEKKLVSSIPGRVISVAVKPETQIKKGEVVAVLESMKMQVAIKAHKDGVVKEVRIKEGSNVARNDVIALID